MARAPSTFPVRASRTSRKHASVFSFRPESFSFNEAKFCNSSFASGLDAAHQSSIFCSRGSTVREGPSLENVLDHKVAPVETLRISNVWCVLKLAQLIFSGDFLITRNWPYWVASSSSIGD